MSGCDINLYYTKTGNGKPLILLHGNNEDQEYFCNQIPVFAKHYQVLAIDTRGHGKSQRGNSQFTIRQFAEDLKCFMETHNIEKAHILGFSDGGNIALIFAMKYPEKVEKLVLCGANLNPKGVKYWTQKPTDISYAIFNRFSGGNEYFKKRAEMLRLMVVDPNILVEDLGKIQSETLVIAGTRDMIKTKHTKAIADAIPNSKLAFVEGNHFMAKHNPISFNNKVLAFLK